MKHCIVGIYDSAVRGFRPHIHLARTADEAQRQARNLMAEDQDTEIHRTPSDFILYTLGTVDLDTGAVEPEMINLGPLSNYRTDKGAPLFEET